MTEEKSDKIAWYELCQVWAEQKKRWVKENNDEIAHIMKPLWAVWEERCPGRWSGEIIRTNAGSYFAVWLAKDGREFNLDEPI